MGVLSRRGAGCIGWALAEELAKGTAPSPGTWLRLYFDAGCKIRRLFSKQIGRRSRSMKARLAIPLAGLVAALLIGASACGTSRNETTSAHQGRAVAQPSGAAATPDKQGAQILKAAQDGDLVQIKSLLEAGTRADYTNPSGVTPLMIAGGLGNTSVATALLDHGADANAKTPGGYTPLMAAALNGQKEMVQLLIKRGADTSAKDVSGRTAAEYAQDQHHSEIVGLLGSPAAR